MNFRDEARYNSLIQKAAMRELFPEEKLELKELSNLRMSKLKDAKRPIYEWDYPINKDNGN